MENFDDGPAGCRNRLVSIDPPLTTYSAPRRAACMRSGDWAPNAASPILTTCCSCRLAVALPPRRLSRTLRDQDGAGHAFRTRPIELAIPITVAGMSFGALVGAGERCPGRARTPKSARRPRPATAVCHHEERASSKTLIYQCLPSRYGFNSGRCAARGCHRDRHRPGRQTGWRRNAARTEGSTRGSRACAPLAGRRRSTLGVTAPGLDGAGRSGDQDQGTARDHGFGKNRFTSRSGPRACSTM